MVDGCSIVLWEQILHIP